MRSLPYRCSAFTIRPQLLSLRASSTVYSTSSAAFAASSTAFTAFSTAFTAFSTAFTVFSTAFTKFSTLPTLCSQLPILRSQTQEQDGCCGQTSFSCVSTRFSTTFQVFLGCSKDKRRRPICSHEIQRCIFALASEIVILFGIKYQCEVIQHGWWTFYSDQKPC